MKISSASLAILGVVIALTGGAGHATAADDMPSGRLVSPPVGYIDLCARLPAQCVQNRYASESQLDAVRQWANRARWAAVFASNPGASVGQAAERPALGPTATIPPPPAGANQVAAAPYRPLTLITQLTAGASTPNLAGQTPAGAVETGWSSAMSASGWLTRWSTVSASMALAPATKPVLAAPEASPARQRIVGLDAAPESIEVGGSALAYGNTQAMWSPPAAQRALRSPYTVDRAPAPSSISSYNPSRPAQPKTVSPRREEESWRPPRFQTDLNMGQLDAINRHINRTIRAVSDQVAFGKAEYWTIPRGANAVGDCEDYVLAKREALIEAGTPAQALSIAVVRTRRGDLHTVLLVATAEGEVVLDNLSQWIVSWREAPYTWHQRQARGSALTWIQPEA